MCDKSVYEIEEEIKKLQSIRDIKKDEAIKKVNSLDYNLDIIEKIYIDKKNKLEKNSYSKSCVVAKFQDRELLPLIEAIKNSLKIINDKISRD